MKNKKKNEELQSRRDFFKKAAKAALPVIGAVVLSAVPSIIKAEEEPLICYGCGGACSYGCGGVCSTGCSNSCSGTCSGGCKGSCMQSCSGSCSRGCRGGSW